MSKHILPKTVSNKSTESSQEGSKSLCCCQYLYPSCTEGCVWDDLGAAIKHPHSSAVWSPRTIKYTDNNNQVIYVINNEALC